MTTRALTLAGVATLVLAGCTTATTPPVATGQASATAVAPVLLTADAQDSHSYAKPAEARVTHVALDLAPDFAAKSLTRNCLT